MNALPPENSPAPGAAKRLVECAGEVLERVSDAFVALDRDWRYTCVNVKAAPIVGRHRRAPRP